MNSQIMEMEDKIKQIFHDLFGIPLDKINDNSSPSNIEKWDSLGHLNLVMAIEQRFQIKLKDQDVVGMLNFGLIKDILKGYQIK